MYWNEIQIRIGFWYWSINTWNLYVYLVHRIWPLSLFQWTTVTQINLVRYTFKMSSLSYFTILRDSIVYLFTWYHIILYRMTQIPFIFISSCVNWSIYQSSFINITYLAITILLVQISQMLSLCFKYVLLNRILQ